MDAIQELASPEANGFCDSPLLGVNTLGSDEDRLKLMELMVFLLQRSVCVEIGINADRLSKLMLSGIYAAEGFEQINDFLSGSYIHYALTVSPHIYISCIKQFWNSVSVKRSGDVTRLQALVDKKNIVISEAVIREILQLNDAEGVVCLPNEEIFAGIAQIGVGKGFSGVETPLFESMLVVRDVAEEAEAQVPAQGDDVQEPAAEEVVTEVVPPTPTSSSPPSPVIPSSPPHQPPCLPQPQDAEVPSLLFQQVLNTCFALARRVEGLENDKAVQQLEIVKLKARVKKLEKINMVKSSKLKRLKKVGTSQQVQEAVEIVTTAKLMTEVVTAAATQAVDASTPIPAAKPKILNIAAAPAVSTRRRKRVVIRDPEEELPSDTLAETPRKAAKKRKLSEEAQEAEDLKKRLEVVEDEDDDVFVEATPLAQKVPVVDYQIVLIDNKPRTMFEEPDGQDAIWRNQKSVHGLALVKRWKLLTSFGVHVITLSTI
nr:hypothetical protein [Tanacetum cinerariifolium]